MRIPLFILFLFCNNGVFSSSPDRFFKSSTPFLHQSEQYLEITRPLPTDDLSPSCAIPVIRHSFANTYNSPPYSVPFFPPPNCPSPWSHVVLQFQASCLGEQYDRIVGIWLAGVELLRTSTAEPTPSGIFWNVRKDITRYSSLLSVKPGSLNFTIMLENVINDVFTGVYLVEVDLLYFYANGNDIKVPSSVLNRKLMNPNLGFGTEKLDEVSQGLYNSPADLIIPVSDDGDRGFWFRIEKESDVHSKGLQIPQNTCRAVLELYVSFHGDDEFWYSNPPNEYIKMNNLTTGRGNGAYREVLVTIDGKFVGSEVPFPVVFTGGINPLFWEPIVSIGAFNLPSYDFDLSPFLGMLLDGEVHQFAINVAAGISYWLVDANLHLWVDRHSSLVQAKSTVHQNHAINVKHISKFEELDGLFRIKAKRNTRSAGWVKSAAGNFTTYVIQELKFESLIRFKSKGTYKLVKQRVQAKRETRINSDTGSLLSRIVSTRKYPLAVITLTIPGPKKDLYKLVTNVSHALEERLSSTQYSSLVYNSQVSGGWMKVKDHSVLSGTANTVQNYTFRDDFSCYTRNVAAKNGKFIEDNSTFACLSSM